MFYLYFIFQEGRGGSWNTEYQETRTLRSKLVRIDMHPHAQV